MVGVRELPAAAQVLLVQSAMKKNKALYRTIRLTLILLLLFIIFTPFALVNAGERGVLMLFGKVQERVLGEGTN